MELRAQEERCKYQSQAFAEANNWIGGDKKNSQRKYDLMQIFEIFL
jgi:hypothetical protein